MRQLADPAGVVTLTQSYAPYGEVTQSVGTSQTSYAFTGENLDANGLTFLRARYFAPTDGRFISRDTWAGDSNRPLSLNRWNYVEGNPVNYTDPTGMFPDWCRAQENRSDYEDCVRQYYNLSAPKDYPVMPEPRQKGMPGCWSGPVAYKAPGYLEGYSATWSFMFGYSYGEELVYDFGTMEKGLFSYETASITFDASVSAMAYHGLVYGFNNVETIEQGYRGPFWFVSGGVGTEFPFPAPSIGTGINYFHAIGGKLWGVSQYYSIGAGISVLPPGFSLAGGVGRSTPIWSRQPYLTSGQANYGKLMNDLIIDADSPVALAFVPSNAMKGLGIELASYWTWIYNEIHLNSK